MTTTTVPQAIHSGMQRGMWLVTDPTIETYQRIRRTQTISTSSTVTQAWENTGALLQQVMKEQARPQK